MPLRRTPVPDPLPLKRCTRCREKLPTSKFQERPKGRYGVAGICIECMEVRYKTEDFTCSRCGQRRPGEDFHRGAQGSVIAQPCKSCRTEMSEIKTRLKRVSEGRAPYHKLSQINEAARTAVCKECGPVHVYATGTRNGSGWRCGKKSDLVSAAWYDEKAKVINKRAAQRWHRIRDVRGEEMRGVCTQCGDVPVKWSGSHFTCANPDRQKKRAEDERRRKRLKVYGMEPEDYDRLREAQNGVCAICGGTDARIDSFGGLVIDHDHRTGKVRGLLCSNCNPGLGFFKDDPKVLRAAIAYLESR